MLSPLSLLNEAYYLAQNPDVASAVARGEFASAAAHFLAFGEHEGRLFTPYFDADFYLQNNPDVAASGMGALAHFTAFGYAEGRAPFAEFVPATYLLLNPDVAAAGVNPLEHFYTFGIAENRQFTPSTTPTPPTPQPSSTPFSFAQFTTNLPSAFSGDEDTNIAITGARVAAPNLSNVASITLSVNNGTITLASNVAGGITAAQITNNGTSSVTVTGALWVQINTSFANNSSIIYTPTANYNGTDTLTITTNDGVVTDTDTATITVNAVPDPSVITNFSNAAAYTEDGALAVIDSSITITDGDSTHMQSATVAITGNFVSGDRLNFTNQLGITGSYSAGTLTLTGNATKADYETAIESITFDSTSNLPTNATRTISLTVNDGSGNSNTQTATVAVTPTTDITSTAMPDLEALANNAWAGLSGATVAANFTSPSAITYTLAQTNETGGAYAGFTINSSTGAISHTGNLPNANMVYRLTVTGTDAEGFSTSQTFELWDHVGALTYTGTTGNDTVSNNTRVWGDSGNDSITVTTGASSTIHGGSGNDTIVTSNFSYVIYGGAGNDSIDVNLGINLDTLFGGNGNDTLRGGTAVDNMYGGTGVDYFVYGTLLESTAAARDIIRDFSQSDGDKINLRNGFDKIITGGTGTAATDSVLGGFEVGNLVWYQSGGNTFIYDPVAANSTFSIQINGLFTLTSGDFVFEGKASTLTGTAGADALSGNGVIAGFAGNDSITVATGASTTVNGGDGNDTIVTDVFNNIVYGGAENDSIDGNLGINLDRFYGGSGNDTMRGGTTGGNIMYGGTGADYFVYGSFNESTAAVRDTIADFSQSDGDKINLRNGFDKIITGGTGTAATDSVLGGFEVGNLITYQSGGNTFIYDPVAANSTFSIQLTGLITLTSADFVFEGGAASLTGTAGNDTISGSQVIVGLAGNDSIRMTVNATTTIMGATEMIRWTVIWA